MADEETTRVQDVTAHIEAVEEMYGPEAYNRIMTLCLKDISLSLAMLVDNSTTSA